MWQKLCIDYCEPLGALLCHAMNMNTKGIVITAVAIRTG